jgi:hypothetical protein
VSTLVGPGSSGSGKAAGLANGNPDAPGLDKGDGTGSGPATGKGLGKELDPGDASDSDAPVTAPVKSSAKTPAEIPVEAQPVGTDLSSAGDVAEDQPIS